MTLRKHNLSCREEWWNKLFIWTRVDGLHLRPASYCGPVSMFCEMWSSRFAPIHSIKREGFIGAMGGGRSDLHRIQVTVILPILRGGIPTESNLHPYPLEWAFLNPERINKSTQGPQDVVIWPRLSIMVPTNPFKNINTQQSPTLTIMVQFIFLLLSFLWDKPRFVLQKNASPNYFLWVHQRHQTALSVT